MEYETSDLGLMVCLWMSNSNETLNYFTYSCAEAMFSWLCYRTFVLFLNINILYELLHTDHSCSQVFAYLDINNFTLKQKMYIPPLA